MKSVKRILSAILAVMLFIPALALFAFAEEGEPQITIDNEPSAQNPTFLVSGAQIESYEWYEMPYENREITDTQENVQPLGTYDSEKGVWTASDEIMYTLFFFIFKPDAGERIFIEHDPSVLASDFALYSEDGEYLYFEPIGSGKACVVVSESKFYHLSCNPELAEPTVKAYISEAREPVLLEGQSTKELTEYEIGKYYFAKAICEDGEEISSDLFYMDYAITSRPSEGDMSVKTNCDGDVLSYEWYYVSHGKEYTVSQSSIISDISVYDGKFENGAWTGEYINISIYGENGDVLYVEPLGDYNTSVTLYSTDIFFETDDEGRFFYELKEDAEFFADFEVRMDAGGTAKIYVLRGEQKIYLENQSFPLYDEVKGEFHVSHAQYGHYDGEKWIGDKNDGLVIYFDNDRDNTLLKLNGANLDRIVFGNYNEEQLIESDENGAFPLSKGTYLLEIYAEQGKRSEAEIFVVDGDKEYKLVPAQHCVFDDENDAFYIDDINNGEFKNGLWYPTDEANEIDIEFDMKAGDVLTVIPSEEFDGDVTVDFGLSETLTLVKELNGSYIFVADEYYDFDLELEGCKNEFSAQIKLERSTASQIVGEDKKELKPNKLGYYFARVTFKNGAEQTSLAMLFENCDHTNSESTPLCLEGSVCSICEGEMPATGHSFGEWKEITVPTRKTSGKEARFCHSCGALEERGTEKLGGSGVGVIFIIIGTGALLALGSVGVSIVIFKKKSLKQ